MNMKTIITEENFRNYARTQGWFETVLYENVSFTIKKDKTPSNMLAVVRKVFKSNFVNKENRKDSWKFTIYCGDKETMKYLNTPIKFETSRQEFNRLFNEDMKRLKNKI